jgi:small subunit ribosomal protein S35
MLLWIPENEPEPEATNCGTSGRSQLQIQAGHFSNALQTSNPRSTTMATALQSFRLTARSCTCREATFQYAAKPIGKRRALSTTAIRYRDPFGKARKALSQDPKEALDNSFMPKTEELGRIERDQIIDEIDSKIGRRHPSLALPVMRKKLKQTFMNLGDPEPWEDEDTLDDDHDDMPSLAHGELEQHREMRHYARLAAWEMPLLASMLNRHIPSNL